MSVQLTELKQLNVPVFTNLMKQFRSIIADPSSNYKELAIAIKGYSYFAAVSHSCVSIVDTSYSYWCSALQGLWKVGGCIIHVQ